jgi:hypothetical protein
MRLPTTRSSISVALAAILEGFSSFESQLPQTWRYEIQGEDRDQPHRGRRAFPVGSAMGQMLGLTLSGYLIRRCTAGWRLPAWAFNGELYLARGDFIWREIHDADAGHKEEVFTKPIVGSKVKISPLLNWLWNNAVDEWRDPNEHREHLPG